MVLVVHDVQLVYARLLFNSFLKVACHIRICCPITIKPLAVCSAGAGRTGTYMAIDTMMYQLEDRQNANIFEYVEKMRTRRTQMVQNAVSDMV